MAHAYPVPFPHAALVLDQEGVIGAQGSVDRVFPLASVTKLVTALAVLAAVREGHIALNQPAGPVGSTVTHLLAHASGLATEGDGTKAQAAPGERRIYSNQGYQELGRVLAEATGMPYADWVVEAVTKPLGMRRFTFEGDPTAAPASGGHASARDLTVLAQELMEPTLLPAELHSQLGTLQYPHLRGVLPGYGMQTDNDWGMGAELRGDKDPHWTGTDFPGQTFGHFGVSGSFLWVDPTIGRAGVFLGSEPFGPWHKENWPQLTNQMRQLGRPQ